VTTEEQTSFAYGIDLARGLSTANSRLCLRCGERHLSECFPKSRKGERESFVCLRCQEDASAEGIERRRVVAAFETARATAERNFETETGATL